MFLLYIDPGTGSALFSILVGLIASAYFLGKAALIKFKFLFQGKKVTLEKKGLKSIVLYNEGPQYYSIFFPIVEELEKRQIPITYLTSAEKDPILEKPYTHVSSKFIGSGNKAFAALNMLEADFCLMTTPGLDVYQLKRSKGVKHYSHILHSPDDATTYRMFGLDYFDSVLLSGEYQKKDIRKLEQLRGTKEKELEVTGCPYLDVLYEKAKNLKTEVFSGKTVLLAPSWGTSGILKRYGEKLLTPLLATEYNIIIRPHPQSKTSEKDLLDTFMEKYQNNKNLLWDFESENLPSLAKADILISDYSGVISDYIFLFDRPVLYATANFDLRPYDAGDLDELPWKFQVLPKIGVALKEEDFETIGAVIEKTFSSVELEKNRQEAKATAWQFQGQAAERTADFMEKVVSGYKL